MRLSYFSKVIQHTVFRSFVFIVSLMLLQSCGIITRPPLITPEENTTAPPPTPVSDTPIPEPAAEKETTTTVIETAQADIVLYQVEYKTPQSVTSVVIGEFSTHEVLAKWSAANNSSSTGNYELDESSGKKYILSIKDSGDGGQMLTMYSEYANQYLLKLHYVNETDEEKLAGPPRVALNCTMKDIENCAPGSVVADPYRDCAHAFDGFVELVITATGRGQDEFTQDVVTPLKKDTDLKNADVWVYLFRKLDKGYYAEVRVATKLCTQAIARKLQGNFKILSENGRQLCIHY